jgi:hypothetical protein
MASLRHNNVPGGDLVTLLGNELAQEIFRSRDDKSFRPERILHSAFLYSRTGDHEPAPLEGHQKSGNSA